MIRLVRDLEQAVVGGGADPANLSHLLGQLALGPAGGIREGDDLHVEPMIARETQQRGERLPAIAGGEIEPSLGIHRQHADDREALVAGPLEKCACVAVLAVSHEIEQCERRDAAPPEARAVLAAQRAIAGPEATDRHDGVATALRRCADAVFGKRQDQESED